MNSELGMWNCQYASDKYIHYGSKHFDINRFKPIKNESLFTKPIGGLWASKVDDNYGWKNLCKNNGFNIGELEEYFIFTLKENVRVLEINNIKDLEPLPKCKKIDEFDFLNIGWVLLDFEEIQKQYDAILVNINDSNLYYALYGWDCNSLLVMNSDCVLEE